MGRSPVLVTSIVTFARPLLISISPAATFISPGIMRGVMRAKCFGNSDERRWSADERTPKEHEIRGPGSMSADKHISGVRSSAVALTCVHLRQSLLCSNDGMVDGDELGAVGEGRLDLDLGNHLGDALHHVVAGEERRAEAHEIGHAS